MKTPPTTVELITPAQAQKYLDTQTRNRNLSETTVARYAEAMEQDRWALTMESIKFDRDGVLIDGQHRLAACVKANKPFRTAVTRGLEHGAFAEMDTGRPRSPGNVLHIEGYSRANLCAAAIKVIQGIQDAENDENVRSFRARGSRQAYLDWMQKHGPQLLEACNVIDTKDARAILRPPSIFVALRFLFGQVNEMRAQEFFQRLSTGIDLTQSDPVYKLRLCLIQELGQKNLRHRPEWKCAITIKAWNSWLRNEPIRTLGFRADEQWPGIGQRMLPRRRRRRAG
jgi:hypothetical protein